jgi:hypothetical protein
MVGVLRLLMLVGAAGGLAAYLRDARRQTTLDRSSGVQIEGPHGDPVGRAALARWGGPAKSALTLLAAEAVIARVARRGGLQGWLGALAVGRLLRSFRV